MRVFYGWWIVFAAFLNLFFSVGIIYYGFPVFYPSIVSSLGFTRAQLTQGFLVGFVAAGLLFGLLAGVLIDSLGPRQVIRVGIWCVGVPLILMGSMTRLWHYYVLCIAEVVGYVLTGPIPNQVLISNWFRLKRGEHQPEAGNDFGDGHWRPTVLQHRGALRKNQAAETDGSHRDRRKDTEPRERPGNISRLEKQVEEEQRADTEG